MTIKTNAILEHFIPLCRGEDDTDLYNLTKKHWQIPRILINTANLYLSSDLLSLIWSVIAAWCPCLLLTASTGIILRWDNLSCDSWLLDCKNSFLFQIIIKFSKLILVITWECKILLWHDVHLSGGILLKWRHDVGNLILATVSQLSPCPSMVLNSV